MLLSPILLSGCLGFGGKTTSTDGTEVLTNQQKIYETSSFSVAIPRDWEIIEAKDFTSNVPTDTVVAFKNNIKHEQFTANANISMMGLEEKISTLDFAKSTKSKIQESLISYEELSMTDLVILVGGVEKNAILLNFKGKKSAADAIINFKQLYIVNNKTGFTLTTASLPDEDESVVKYIDEMIDSFSLK